jgi:membrane-bound lytic murein transglycosylase B
VGWNTLAAIGFVETEHASMNGATLHSDGSVTPAIIGLPLDGNGVAAVPDTDGGAVDSDPEWDRAVGPMQFIPAVWKTAAQDGNRDGATDINQIDDAALAAAMHLCEAGGDLTKAENWIAAISAYNPSIEYNNRVAEAASHYATLR